jgi:DNA repair protein RadC
MDKGTPKNNPHKGHRNRLKQRFLTEGLDGFEPHNALELLMFYSQPYRDMNETAHALIEKFGCFSSVLDAAYEELIEVDGVGAHTALLIKLIPELCRYYLTDRSGQAEFVTSAEQAGRYFLPRFKGYTNETVLMLSLDDKGECLMCTKLFEGGINSAQIDIRKVMEAALRTKASRVILAHNHTSGIALPSREDEEATKRIAEVLHAVGIELADHIVVAGDQFVSMAQSGVFWQRR